jgi:1-deoxy-D-xylulose 5-phosphate reductoisomerase
VNAFLDGSIQFSGIVRTVQRALEAFPGGRDSLADILEADRWAREYVKANSGRLKA